MKLSQYNFFFLEPFIIVAGEPRAKKCNQGSETFIVGSAKLLVFQAMCHAAQGAQALGDGQEVREKNTFLIKFLKNQANNNLEEIHDFYTSQISGLFAQLRSRNRYPGGVVSRGRCVLLDLLVLLGSAVDLRTLLGCQ